MSARKLNILIWNPHTSAEEKGNNFHLSLSSYFSWIRSDEIKRPFNDLQIVFIL